MTRSRVAVRMALAVVGAAAMAMLAGSPAAAGEPTDAEVKSPYCDYIAKESVKIRDKPTTSSTALGLLPKGGRIDCDSQEQAGGSYTSCGGGYFWSSVNYQGRRAWVASACVTWDPN